jgi:hypothetical protein
MTWGAFLVLHFLDPEHEQEDQGRHCELPFHNTGHVPVHFFAQELVMFGTIQVLAPLIPIPYEEGSGNDRHRVGVFQPPRPTC